MLKLSPMEMRALFCNTGKIEQEHIREGSFTMAAESPGGATMAGVHVCFQQNSIVIGLELAQFSSPLGRLPILYL